MIIWCLPGTPQIVGISSEVDEVGRYITWSIESRTGILIIGGN